MSPLPQPIRRRTVLVNPRLQIGTALVFTAMVFLGGALFAWVFHQGSREALWAASYQGHFRLDSPYQVVGDPMIRQLVALFAVLVAACTLAFLLLIRRIRAGVNRLREVLRMSGEGDLSSPANAPGLREIGIFGEQLDAVRGSMLEQIREIREEAEILRKEPLPPEEFQERWGRLKQKIGRIVT